MKLKKPEEQKWCEKGRLWKKNRVDVNASTLVVSDSSKQDTQR